MALGGRVLPGSSDPAKYKNSAETPIYSKRRTLYALNWAKADIVRTGEVVVCEGYTDVIGLFGAGAERAVATCGTALAEEHVKILRNFASRIVLAFDADSAGQAAAGRFYEWERRLEVDVAVAALPPGSDPGELAASDPKALLSAVKDAKPFLMFRVERILAGAELGTAEGRAKAADLALGAVAEHPDDLVRDQYVMLVADRCRLEPDRLRDRLERIRREGPRPSAAEATGAGRRAVDHHPPATGRSSRARPRDANAGAPPSSGPASRRSVSPSTARNRSARASKRCSSPTTYSAKPSGPSSEPTICTRRSTDPLPRWPRSSLASRSRNHAPLPRTSSSSWCAT